jgi:hypothetical protein
VQLVRELGIDVEAPARADLRVLRNCRFLMMENHGLFASFSVQAAAGWSFSRMEMTKFFAVMLLLERLLNWPSESFQSHISIRGMMAFW